ncbi:hypothetical protein HAX54_021056, partial [Datura stramonium]|nr:hypothetical protein [Datura stramonium]
NSLENTEVVQHVELYAILLTKLLCFLNFERFRPMYGNDFSKIRIIWVSCPKQERDTDCGRFIVKYADMLMNRENLADFDSSTMNDYMKNWSINLFAHGYNKSVLEGLHSIRALIEGEVDNTIGGGGDGDDVV